MDYSHSSVYSDGGTGVCNQEILNFLDVAVAQKNKSSWNFCDIGRQMIRIYFLTFAIPQYNQTDAYYLIAFQSSSFGIFDIILG